MKVFICSITVFALICILVTINSVVLCNYAADLIEYTKNLPEEPDSDSADRLIDLWIRYEKIFNITVSHTVTDQIELVLSDIRCSTDPALYKSKCATLLILLQDMKETATFSLNRII